MCNNKLKILESISRSGLPTMKIEEFYIHSRYDPVKEAKLFVEKHYRPGFIHILVGYGLGYFAKEFIKIFSENETLIIVDPIKGLKIDDKDYTILMQSSPIKELESMFSGMIPNHANVTLIFSPNYDKVFPEYCLELVKVIKSRLEMNKINENTLRLFSSEWQRNYIYNLMNIPKDSDIREIKQRFNLPVIVASGGPSLSKQINLLTKLRSNFILIASGSTINTLIHFGIEPDYIVSIDGGENNYRHFKDINLKNSKLVYSLLNHYKIRHSFQNESYHFLTSDSYGIEDHYYSITGKTLEKIRGGGTVASYALSFARYISSGPIAIIGQDLAYTDNKTHEENNKNYTEVDAEYIKERKLFYTDSYYGDLVLTDLAFYSMKETFEILINELNNTHIIFNCTEGGVLLKGYQNISFKEFCEKYIHKNNVFKLSETSVNVMDYHLNDIVLEKLKQELLIYAELEQIINENLKLLSKTSKKRIFNKSILKKMDDNDSIFRDNYKKTCISISIEIVTFEILKYYSPEKNETINETYNRVYEQNKSLLENFLVIINTAKNFIEEVIILYPRE